VPHKALAKLVRGKLKAALADKRPDLIAPRAAWTKPWVVHIAHWGEGAEAVLWLMSPAASYITGAIVPIGGGR